jgi:hypothetical protein
MSTQDKIRDFFNPMINGLLRSDMVIVNFRDFLLEKNKRYGDSALTPTKVFSRLSSANSIEIRLDDKISRILNSGLFKKNDICDLLGYLSLYCISKKWQFSYNSIPLDYLNLNVMELIGVVKKSPFKRKAKTLALITAVINMMTDNEWNRFTDMLD